MFRFWHLLFSSLILMSASMVLAQADPVEEALILSNYAADTGTLLIELETLGLIPSGAVPVLEQNNLTFVGENAQFSNFALDNTSSHIVMGAVLNFAPDADTLEFCGIATRTQRAESNRLEDGNNITTIRLDVYAAIGVDHAGNIFAYEIDGDTSSDLALSEAEIDLSQPVYLLIVVIDDRMTVFANGEAVIRDYELTLPSGGLAFLYAGMAEESSCRAQTLFAYSIADELVDSCRVTSANGINQRSGPGTDFARVEQLLAGESLEAIGQTIGTDGFVWWLLEDETWVRDDVVDTSGFCRVLPTVDV